MERLIVLDTETTGLSPQDDRIVEIGCVELLNKRIGEEQQWYINPGIPIPQEAVEIHGITDEMVKDKPSFSIISKEFVDFIGDDQLVIHNAAFDMRFLNAELKRAGWDTLEDDRAIDTLLMARRRFPGSPATLSSLWH